MTIWRRWLTLVFFISIVGAAERTASAQNLTLTWDPSWDPSVVGYLVYVGTSPGEYTATYDVGSANWFAFDASPDQPYFLAVASYADGYRVGPPSSEVSTSPQSAASPPTDVALWNPGDQWTPGGQQTALQLYGEDPTGQGLTFSQQGLPSGLWLEAGSGIVYGTPTDAGSYWVTVSASNGYSTSSQSFTWTTWFSATDVTPPVVTLTLTETGEWESNGYVTLGGSAVDDVGVTAVWWINGRGESGLASGTDFWYTATWLQPGPNDFTILAYDEAGNFGATTYSVYW